MALGKALLEAQYHFVTVTPETHRRVLERAALAADAPPTLRDIFGWNRPFAPGALPAPLLDLARRAELLDELTDGTGRLVSRVRFSRLGERLFVHSAYPTAAADAVFFGPDTYRFHDLVQAETRGRRFRRAVDVGSGSGAGGLGLVDVADAVVLADISETALTFARVNAELAYAAAKTAVVLSDVLASVEGDVDLVIANPPYLVDPLARAYRHGGGAHGEALACRIVDEALARLAPGGRLVLYTGAPVVRGTDVLRSSVLAACVRAGADVGYRELDPDVFGEEIEHNAAYADVERIAAVALVATVPG